jgi:hypothetical protein
VSLLRDHPLMLTIKTFGRRRRRSTRRGVLVRVGSQYEPATVLATTGEPILLRFRRETFAASGGRVIFPALGKSIELPLFGEVALELLLERGSYEFTCEQGLLRGVLEVDEPRRPRVLQRSQTPSWLRASSVAPITTPPLSLGERRPLDPVIAAPDALEARFFALGINRQRCLHGFPE